MKKKLEKISSIFETADNSSQISAVTPPGECWVNFSCVFVTSLYSLTKTSFQSGVKTCFRRCGRKIRLLGNNDESDVALTLVGDVKRLRKSLIFDFYKN